MIIVMRNREGKAGGGKGPMLSERSFTLATSNDQTLFIIGFSHTAGLDIQASTKIFPTMKAGHNTMPSVLIIDGTRVNDVRIYEDEIAPTVISRYGTGGGNVPAVFPIQGTIIGRSDTAGPQGKGYGNENDPMFTIDTVGGHGVASETTVRRLTPTECERLQGFPDNWTEGQADSQRYKQMGNAVAVPVVSWIVQRLVEANND